MHSDVGFAPTKTKLQWAISIGSFSGVGGHVVDLVGLNSLLPQWCFPTQCLLENEESIGFHSGQSGQGGASGHVAVEIRN